jgi:photosynthetic reaction center H subunit
MKGEIIGNFDVAQVTLYVFFIFFIGLLFYLRREDRREGYPLFSEPSNRLKGDDFLFIPPAKTFKLADGSTVQAPNGKWDQRTPNGQKIGAWPGAPLVPNGDPMLAAVGPGSFAEREDKPEMTLEGALKIVPLRVATAYACDTRDGDPRGYKVIGADKGIAGTITDIWVDRSEALFRYLEMSVGGRKALIPMNFAKIDKGRKEVRIHALMANQFANIPALANPDQVTKLEEEKVCAYFGAGMLYAHPSRTEPLL